jgi:4-carboxymuconolactone decarboxylase
MAEPPATPAAPNPNHARIAGVVPHLVELTQSVLFGDVWERPGLSKRDRSLITCAALVATYRPEQLRGHILRALSNGLTIDELGEMITHLAFYSGWPGSMSASTILAGIAEEQSAQK